MKITIVNRQKQVRLNRTALRDLAAFLMARPAQQRSPQTPRHELNLIVCDNARMRAWNRALFGRNEPTDVISVGYPSLPGETAGGAGEVVVNAERAVCGRRPAGWNPSRELALYVAHGCHHLSGADDADAGARRRMRRRELNWLKQAAAGGLSLALIEEPAAAERASPALAEAPPGRAVTAP